MEWQLLPVHALTMAKAATVPTPLLIKVQSAIYLRHFYVTGCWSESGYYDGNRDGCHWALLFAELI